MTETGRSKKGIFCDCNRIGCIICKKNLREKTIGDFNKTVRLIKDFVADVISIASPPEDPRQPVKPESSMCAEPYAEKEIALANSRIEDLKHQNDILRRKLAALDKGPDIS